MHLLRPGQAGQSWLLLCRGAKRNPEHKGGGEGESLVQDDSIPSYCSSSSLSVFFPFEKREEMSQNSNIGPKGAPHSQRMSKRAGGSQTPVLLALKTMSASLRRGKHTDQSWLGFQPPAELDWWETDSMSTSSLRFQFVF